MFFWNAAEEKLGLEDGKGSHVRACGRKEHRRRPCPEVQKALDKGSLFEAVPTFKWKIGGDCPNTAAHR
jgi:hypothetical protein